MKFGLRIIKTGMAIGLAMYVTDLLGNDGFIYAGLIAMFAIQPSIYRSYITMFDQFKANVIGALVATTIVVLFGNSFLMVSIAAMITVSFCVKFNVLDKVPPLVSVVAIMETNTGDYSTIEFALVRFGAVSIGFLTAFLFNVLFFPPKHDERLLTLIINLNEKIRTITDVYFKQPCDYKKLQDEIHQLDKQFNYLYSLYNYFHEEKHFPKSVMRKRYRKIVVMRQLIITSKLHYQLLKKFRKTENDWHHLPDSLQEKIRLHVQSLQSFHHDLLCKIKKKATEPVVLSDSSAIIQEYTQILRIYSQVTARPNDYTYLDKRWMNILPLLSHMTEYADELIHLDHVIHSYYTYHQNKKHSILSKKFSRFLP